MNYGSIFKLVPFVKAKLGLELSILLILAFLFINAPTIYGDYAEVIQFQFLAYFIIFLLLRKKAGTESFETGIFNFVLWFFITGIAMLGIYMVAPGTPAIIASIESTMLFIGFGLVHGFLKAYIEEIIFRHQLPIEWGLGDNVSNLLFGVFHFSTLYASAAFATTAGLLSAAAFWPYVIINTLILTSLGFVWTFVRNANNGSIAAAAGSHTAYNLFALGIGIKVFSALTGGGS